MQGFHHVAVQCADLAACERFYREVLGLAVLRRWPRPEGGDRSVWLAVGDGFLALERAPRSAVAGRSGEGATSGGGEGAWASADPGLHLVALRIGAAERAAWEARLRERRVPVVHRTPFTLYVRDPEGNRVGLSHWPDAAGEGPPPGGEPAGGG